MALAEGWAASREAFLQDTIGARTGSARLTSAWRVLVELSWRLIGRRTFSAEGLSGRLIVNAPGWKPEIGLGEGLRSAYRWYIEGEGRALPGRAGRHPRHI